MARSEENVIVQKAREFLTNKDVKRELRTLPNPFGDREASLKMINISEQFVGKRKHGS